MVSERSEGFKEKPGKVFDMIAFEADFCASTKEKIGNYPILYACTSYAISVSNLCFLTSGERVCFFSVFCTPLFYSVK